MTESNLITVQVQEVGELSMTASLVVGVRERPVVVIEFYPQEQPQARLTVTHSGWNGEITGGQSLAALLRETADVVDISAAEIPEAEQ